MVDPGGTETDVERGLPSIGTGMSILRGRGRGRSRQFVQGQDDIDSDFSDLSSELSCGSDNDEKVESGTSNESGPSSRGQGLVGRGHGRGDSRPERDAGSSVRRSIGRGRGLGIQAASFSSSDLSTGSSLSLEEDMGMMSVATQLEKSSDDSIVSLTLPPAPPPVSEYLPPQPRITGLFPAKLTTGKSCKVETNHFTVSVRIPEGIIYMYDVVLEPPWKRPYRRSDKRLYHDTIAKWKEVCPAVKAEKNCWVFDGHSQLYSTRKHRVEEFETMKLSVWSMEEEKEVTMMVKNVDRVADVRVNQEILEWATRGRSGSLPQDALQALDIVIKHAISNDLNFESIGRSYFPTSGKTLDVGFGKEVWIGTFSAVRPFGWKNNNVLLTLNVDTAAKPAIKCLHLTKRLGNKDSYIQEVLTTKKGTVDLSEGLNEAQRKIVSKDIEGLKIKYELPAKDGVRKRQHRIIEMRKNSAKEEKIEVDGKSISVVEYFSSQYGIKLDYPELPCLWVGSRLKTTFIPPEFCTMQSQPMPSKKKLLDESVAKMIRSTATKPLDRQRKIMEGLKMNNAAYKNDPYAKEFGITVSGEMTRLTGRILDPPAIEYKEHGKMRNVVNINKANPGKWFQEKNIFKDGKTINNWAVIDLAQMPEAQFKEIQSGFKTVGKENGLTFSNPALQRVQGSMRDVDQASIKIEGLLKGVVEYAEGLKKELDFVLVIFPFKAGLLYDRIKHLGDMKYDVTTQCCLKNTLYKGDKLSSQVLANICLKINSKLGGINHVLAKSSRPSLLTKPVMIMGADVSHPAPESRRFKPSIAAVVGSMEPTATKYEVQVRIQDTGLDSNEEVIKDMKDVTKNLLKNFYDKNQGRKPTRLVMFRDGCSEGQFLTVLANELKAMRDACKELEEGYEPPITYIVVQKRHHTRFFPIDNNKYRNGNALAGTVIDQGINHPTEGDFYLLSHEGIQGTSRPCHYHVLWDDNNFTAEDLEILSYYLCHLYSRCTRAVSYPTPTYYAHLVADRARKHHNELSGLDIGSGSGNFKGELTENEKRDIKKIVEEGVKKSMYFV